MSGPPLTEFSGFAHGLKGVEMDVIICYVVYEGHLESS